MNSYDKSFDEKRKRIAKVRIWIDYAIIGLLCCMAGISALITWLVMRLVA